MGWLIWAPVDAALPGFAGYVVGRELAQEGVDRGQPSPGDDEAEPLAAAEHSGGVPERYGDLDGLAGGQLVDAGEGGDGYVGGGLLGVEVAQRGAEPAAGDPVTAPAVG